MAEVYVAAAEPEPLFCEGGIIFYREGVRRGLALDHQLRVVVHNSRERIDISDRCACCGETQQATFTAEFDNFGNVRIKWDGEFCNIYLFRNYEPVRCAVTWGKFSPRELPKARRPCANKSCAGYVCLLTGPPAAYKIRRAPFAELDWQVFEKDEAAENMLRLLFDSYDKILRPFELQ